MKVSRLVIGIISMVLFLLVTLESCAAGVGNAFTGNGEISGTAGIMLSICMLIGGILGVCCRKGRAGIIVAGSFYAFGGLIGNANAGTLYGDLRVWSFISLVFALVFMLTAIWP